MTLSDFLNHWSISENPFRGEEARDDSVFARMSAGHRPGTPRGSANPAAHSSFHSDFEKILGDLARPSTSIVFGEKGSGKTAIRLQINARVNAYNVDHPNAKVLLIAYDDLNAWLGRLHERAGGKTPLESFQSLRLVDHIDAMLGMTVPRLVDALPNGPRYFATIQVFLAGGVPEVMLHLRDAGLLRLVFAVLALPFLLLLRAKNFILNRCSILTRMSCNCKDSSSRYLAPQNDFFSHALTAIE